MARSQSLKRNLAANYLGQAWVSLLGLIFLPLYVKYLGAEALGLIGLFTLLQAWLTLLDLGITPTLNREMARFTAGAHSPQWIAALLRSLEVVGALIALVIAATAWIAAGYLAAEWLQAESLPVAVVRQALQLMGLVIALRFCEGIFRGALLGLQRQLFYNVVNAGMATVRFAGAFMVVALISPSIRAFYVWQAAVSLGSVAVFALAVHRSLPRTHEPVRVSRAAFMSVRQFAGGMFAITCLSLLLTQVDKVLLSRLVPLSEFGYYTLAATAAGALTMGVAPILQSVYPRLVELVTTANERALAATYHQWCQLVLVATLPLMLLLTLFPEGVLYAWSGNRQLAAETAPLVRPLALGTFLNALMWMPYQSQLAHGWTSLTIRVNLAAVAVIVPAILALVPRYGARAAAWLWVALNAAYVVADIHLMHQRILSGEKKRWYLQDVAVPLGSATLVGLLLWLAAPSPAAHRLLWGAYLAGVAVVTTVVALLSADCLRPHVTMLLNRLVAR